MVKTPSLKPCPFCGGKDIRFSMKIDGKHYHVIRYRVAMYCNKCHTYGPITFTEEVLRTNYAGREAIKKDDAVKVQAENLWNGRATNETPHINEH